MESTPVGNGFAAASMYNLPTADPIVEPTMCFNTNDPSTRRGPDFVPVAVGSSTCSAMMTAGTATFTRPGSTYGPYNLKPWQVVSSPYNAEQKASTYIELPALTLTYDFDAFSVKLISGWLHDVAKTRSTVNSTVPSGQVTPTNLANTTSPPYTYNTIAEGATHIGNQVIPSGVPFLAALPGQTAGHFVSNNENKQVSEELRFTSTPGAGPVTWTAGLFYLDDKHRAQYYNLYEPGKINGTAEALYGITAAQRWGSPVLPGPAGLDNFDHKYQELIDTQYAAYGQVDYNVTSAFQATVGARKSLVKFSYDQYELGEVVGSSVATYKNGLRTRGKTRETVFTPKFGVKYNFTPNKLVYFNASKGFRPGGANEPSTANICGPGLKAFYGLTVNDLPLNYKQDTVWSYELGTKLGLADGRIQVNADVYRIDWNNIQSTQNAGACGVVFTTNAGNARSQGVEVSAQALLFDALTADVDFEYDSAKYLQDVVAIQGNPNPDVAAGQCAVTGGKCLNLVSAFKGEKFAMPAWTLHVGGRYNWVVGDYNPYFRADVKIAAGYNRSVFEIGGWSPDTNSVPRDVEVNVRTGVDYKNYDFNLFVTNLFNYDNGAKGGGRAGCGNEACTSYRRYNALKSISAPQPRTIGLQIVYNN